MLASYSTTNSTSYTLCITLSFLCIALVLVTYYTVHGLRIFVSPYPPKLCSSKSFGFDVVNYTLKNQSGILGRVSLYKSSYKLGEDVTGTIDLGGASISCLQVREGSKGGERSREGYSLFPSSSVWFCNALRR